MAITIETDEVQFPPLISRGATGGPVFSTRVIVSATGVEQRIGEWAVARHQWDVSHALRTPTSMNALMAFFIARQGKSRGFRFKDWRDYQATAAPLTPTGASTLQLTKTYTSGVQSYVRKIYKPVQSAGIVLTVGGSPSTAFALDWNSGLLFLSVLLSGSITAITKAASAVVTSAAHPFSIGEYVEFSGVVGMTEINGEVGQITAKTVNTFTVNIASTAFTTYVSGGSAKKYLQPSDVVTWTGEFDVPVRFDTDQMQLLQADSQARAWDNIPIIELRGVPVVTPQVAP